MGSFVVVMCNISQQTPLSSFFLLVSLNTNMQRHNQRVPPPPYDPTFRNRVRPSQPPPSYQEHMQLEAYRLRLLERDRQSERRSAPQWLECCHQTLTASTPGDMAQQLLARVLTLARAASVRLGTQYEVDRTCSICMDPFFDAPGRAVEMYALPCGHVVHVGCGIPWFHEETTCPVCRADVHDLALRCDGRVGSDTSEEMNSNGSASEDSWMDAEEEVMRDWEAEATALDSDDENRCFEEQTHSWGVSRTVRSERRFREAEYRRRVAEDSYY